MSAKWLVALRPPREEEILRKNMYSVWGTGYSYRLDVRYKYTLIDISNL